MRIGEVIVNFIGNYTWGTYVVSELGKYDTFLGENKVFGNRKNIKNFIDNSIYRDVYNSCAIENNPLSLSKVEYICKVNPGTGNIRERREVWNLYTATRKWYELGIRGDGLIDEKVVKEMHHEIMNGLIDRRSCLGEWRDVNVRVGSYIPPNHFEVGNKMQRLLGYLLGVKDSDVNHPIVSAAYIHVLFEMIHPFIDGNGRVGRLLMNMFLLEQGYPTCIIDVKDRYKYYSALEIAGETRDLTPMIKLMLKSMNDWRSE